VQGKKAVARKPVPGYALGRGHGDDGLKPWLCGEGSRPEPLWSGRSRPRRYRVKDEVGRVLTKYELLVGQQFPPHGWWALDYPDAFGVAVNAFSVAAVSM
jgi:hypothetical protein